MQPARIGSRIGHGLAALSWLEVAPAEAAVYGESDRAEQEAASAGKASRPARVPILTLAIRALLIWGLIQVAVVAVAALGSLLGSSAIMDYRYGYQLVPDIVPTVFFAVCTTVSLGASWLVVPRVMSRHAHPVVYALLAVSVITGVLVNRVLVFASPMYVEKALVYYVVLASTGFLVVVAQAAWRTRRRLEGLLGSLVDRTSTASRGALELHDELRRRSNAYRIESRVSIATILLVLTGGATIFIGADAITALDDDQRLRRATNKITSAQRTLTGVAEVVSELAGYSDVAGSLARAKAALDEDLHAYVSCDLTQVDAQLANIGELEIDGGSSLRYRELLREIESANRHIAHLVGEAPAEGASSVLEEELDDLISDRKEDEALRTILASLSTRLGAAFLVAFLVRILTSHFRYSARMASHYESRAYVLSRGDGGDEV